MKLCVVQDDGHIYAEFSTEKFKKLLVESFKKTGDVVRAFERVQDELKNVVLHS